MKTPHGHIKVETDTLVHRNTIDIIDKCLRDKKPFALAYQENEKKGAWIFVPDKLYAVHTCGDENTFNCWENFLDFIKLTLAVYPILIDVDRLLPKPPPKIEIVER